MNTNPLAGLSPDLLTALDDLGSERMLSVFSVNVMHAMHDVAKAARGENAEAFIATVSFAATALPDETYSSSRLQILGPTMVAALGQTAMLLTRLAVLTVRRVTETRAQAGVNEAIVASAIVRRYGRQPAPTATEKAVSTRRAKRYAKAPIL